MKVNGKTALGKAMGYKLGRTVLNTPENGKMINLAEKVN